MEVFLDIVNEQDAQASWNEIAAERSGKPVKHVVKPVETPAVIQDAEVKPDPLAELQARFAELEKVAGRVRNIESTVGNINHTQKQLKEMIDAGKSAANQSNNSPSQNEIKQASVNTAKWDALKSDYPDWADATEELLSARMSNNFDAKAFEEQIMERMKGETKAARQEIIHSALDAVFPDWKEDLNTTEFDSWMKEQPDNIKSLFESDKVGDAARMMRLYEKSKQSNPESEIVEQRKNKLAAATATPKGISTPKSTQKLYADMNADERWNYEKRQRAKRS